MTKRKVESQIVGILKAAKEITKGWIELYKNKRPHDWLNALTPFEYKNTA